MRRTRLTRQGSPTRCCDPLAVAITLLAFGLFLWRADAKGIWWDEGLSLYRAQGSPAAILSNRIDFPGAPTVDQHPPLYFLALHAVMRGAGESDVALRFPSVLFGTLLVPVVYALGVRLDGQRAARVAGLLAALSPFHLWYAQEARPYTMVAALGATSMLALWHAVSRRSRTAMVAAMVLAGLAVMAQYFAALLLPVAGLAVIASWLDGRRAVRAGIRALPRRWWVAVVLPSAVLAATAWTVWPLVPTLAIHRRYVPLHIILLDSLNSFSLGLSVNLREVWPLDVAFGLLLLAGLVAMARRRPAIDGAPGEMHLHRRFAGLALLLGYLLAPALGIWLVSLWVPVYMNSRYVIVSSPAFCLGVALGIDVLWRWRRAAGAVVLLVLVAGMGYSLVRYHRHERYRERQDYRGAAAFIAANERVGDVVVVTGHENVVPFEHYYRGHLPVTASPTRAFEVERIGPDLTALAAGHGRLWLVDCPAHVSDPQGLVVQWLEEHMRPGDRRAFPGYYGASVTVRTYTPHDPVNVAPNVAGRPLGAFGDLLALQGYVVRAFDDAGQPHEVRVSPGAESARVTVVPAGNVVSAELRVRVQGSLPELKTSLRLVDVEGTPWAQRDREPLRILSTREWPPGSEVTFDVELPVPPGTPPGIYALQLWVYDAQSLEPVAFEAAAPTEGPALHLAPLRVGPPARPFTAEEFLGVVAPLRFPARFGRALDLVAYDLAPRSLGASDVVTLHFFWRVRDPAPWRYDAVLHWTDAAGRVVHTQAHPIVVGSDIAQPMRRGEALHGIVRFAAPEDLPAGDYTLHLLVRAVEDGRFLWLSRGIIPWPSHNLILGTVTIRRGAASRS